MNFLPGVYVDKHMAAGNPNTMFKDLASGTVVIVNFNHNGQPFRIKFTKSYDDYGAFMYAYSGATGEMNMRNHVEHGYVGTHYRTLMDSIAVGAKNRFDIEPTDITFTVMPPAN